MKFLTFAALLGLASAVTIERAAPHRRLAEEDAERGCYRSPFTGRTVCSLAEEEEDRRRGRLAEEEEDRRRRLAEEDAEKRCFYSYSVHKTVCK